jgi:hypothetical protein
MLTRDFYKFSEAAALFGDDREALRQAIVMRKIRTFVELVDSIGWAWPESDGSFPESGREHFTRWRKISAEDFERDFNPSEDDSKPYHLNGWFFLSTPYAEAVVRGSAQIQAGTVQVNPGMDAYPIHQFDVHLPSLTIDMLWILASEIEGLKAGALRPGAASLPYGLPRLSPEKLPMLPPEKPLATRERNNLLRVIAALAKQAKLDLDAPGSAVALEAAVAAAGFDGPKEKAIRAMLQEMSQLG